MADAAAAFGWNRLGSGWAWLCWAVLGWLQGLVVGQ
jgi:hypothetical protein